MAGLYDMLDEEFRRPEQPDPYGMLAAALGGGMAPSLADVGNPLMSYIPGETQRALRTGPSDPAASLTMADAKRWQDRVARAIDTTRWSQRDEASGGGSDATVRESFGKMAPKPMTEGPYGLSGPSSSDWRWRQNNPAYAMPYDLQMTPDDLLALQRRRPLLSRFPAMGMPFGLGVVR